MEYYTTTTIDTPIIMLVIGLVIMLVGGIVAATFVKDEGKMIKWVTSFVSVGGCLTIASVVMLLI